jgi:hypothetical protein
MIIFLLLFLSFHYDFNEKTKKKDFWYLVCLVIFVLIVGLRWRLGVDTPNYINMFYHEYPSLHELSWDDFSIGNDPLFVLINSCVKACDGRFYIVQLIQSMFVNTLIFVYIKRHSSYIFTCLLFYALTFYLGFNTDIMRASMSIVLSLFSNDFFLKKKWIKGYLLLVIGCFFHSQTVLLLALPIFLFLRFNKFGIAVILGGFLVGRILQPIMIDYVFLFEDNEDISNKMTGYFESDTYGSQGGNMNFFIVHIFPNIVYSVIALLYLKYRSAKQSIMRLEPFLMLGLLFLFVQMSLQVAYRYVDYYRMYFVLFMAEAFGIWVKNSNCLTRGVAFARTHFFFIPYFVLVNWIYIVHYEWIYPYSSVLERNLDHHRESSYIRWDRPKGKLEEY